MRAALNNDFTVVGKCTMYKDHRKDSCVQSNGMLHCVLQGHRKIRVHFSKKASFRGRRSPLMFALGCCLRKGKCLF